ncbi:hypothetical protein [Nocardiopsis sp. MG754419]|uniref:hypothetical protein n=1 Tax=Nocardiopsis sp. MG754419 TaxID=2259865 RepID=UPI001BA7BA46|nr:hypothetical protein [Nocardiopsis sp. MG754419]MBR8743271.1 hypothetical protein [Nocardiopsis sp. MG754419]
MSHTEPQASFLDLLASTYTGHGVATTVLPPTGMRLHLPENDHGRDHVDVDYADVVRDMTAVPGEEHPDYARGIVFGMLRQLRSRGIAVGTHYPPLSSDRPRQALLAALSSCGVEARFAFPHILGVALPDGREGRQDVSDFLSAVEEADEDATLKEAVAFAEAVRAQVDRVAAPSGAEGRLRVRLYPESAFPEGVLGSLVARRMAAGVAEVVVMDHPDSIRPLNQGDLAGLGTTPEEVFERAVEGALSEPVDVGRMDALGTPVVHIGAADGYYVGAQLHVLARHLGEARHGALVVFPSPSVVMAHVLGESEPIAAMTTLQELARRYAADADRPITDKLFWWRPESAAGGRPRLAEVRVEQNEQTGGVGLYTEDEDFGPLLRSLV